MTVSPAVLYEVTGGIATLTLNRPDNRNAVSTELLNGLGDGLEEASRDDGVRIVVLTNTGTAFCAGADLKSGEASEVPRYDFAQILELIQYGEKPVIGKIAGHCTGGGLGLAAACDVSIISDDAILGFTEVRLGVAPAIISVVCLPKMRQSDAMELFLTGERISGSKATEVGLINQSVPPGDFEDAFTALIDKIRRGGPKALVACKSLVRQVPGMQRSDGFKWTSKLSADLFQSAEAREGMAAFREKRDADWIESS